MKRITLIGLLVLPASFLILCHWALLAQGQEISAEVYKALETSSNVKVVIALRCTMPSTDIEGLKEEITNVQEAVLSQLDENDFTLIDQWIFACGLAGEINMSGLERLISNLDVVRVDLDKEMKLNLNQSVPLINGDDVHNLGVTGDGVTVAVLDTGIDTNHSDLSDNLIGEQCFCQFLGFGCCPNGDNQQGGAGSAEDDNGHGTHVSGIITSKGTNAPIGVAPDANILAIKVGSAIGTFLPTDALTALDWLIDNLNQFPGLKVLNASFGGTDLFNGSCDNADGITMQAVNLVSILKNNGVIVFAASGNDASSIGLPVPACLSNVVSVGAVYDSNVGELDWGICEDITTAADQVTCFSDTNNTLDLLAPGAIITSASIGGGFITESGTSMASPHAAGAAALLLEVNPNLTPDQMKMILKDSGSLVTDPSNGLSFPRIDVLAALNMSSSVNIVATDSTAKEAGLTTGAFTLTRTGSTDSSLTVNYTVGGTASPGSDYAALPVSTTIPAGSSSAVITVTPIDDLQVEASETVTVTLKSGAGYIVGSPSVATITITNNDFSISVDKAGSGSGTVTSAAGDIICGGVCTKVFEQGTIVTFTAIQNPGSAFTGFSGVGCDGTAPCTITVNGNVTVIATFEATAFAFTNEPLIPGTTEIKTIHISQLRNAANQLRAQGGLASFVFTDPTLIVGVTEVKRVHITEIRAALTSAALALGRPAPNFSTDPNIVSGTTAIKGAHIRELRDAVRAIE